MPSLTVCKKTLENMINLKLDDDQLYDILFDFGIEIDEITKENDLVKYKLDIAANRYDLLCMEGISYALKSYIKNEKFCDISNLLKKSDISVIQHETHERIHIACCVIRNIDLSDSYDSLISYQDKLHTSIGRNRSLVAIGTHDLDSISGQIEYKSINLSEVSFTPLSGKTKIKGSDLESYYENDSKISKYFPLLSDRKRSVAFVADGNILSIPPIINSDMSKISRKTKNMFVEVTGTDYNKVQTTLKLIMYNFRTNEMERIEILKGEKDVTQKKDVTPKFVNREFSISVDYVNSKLKLGLSYSEIERHLSRMMLSSELVGENIIVKVPDVRSDIIHPVDILEDISISYGFNNFAKSKTIFSTIGKEDEMNKFTNKLRTEMSLCGFNEILTLSLLSKEENIIDQEKMVVVENPKSRDYCAVRTSLIPGMLKSVASNLHARLPIKLFESSDVVHNDNTLNIRMLCGAIASTSSKLEDVQGALSFLLKKCGLNDFCYKFGSEKDDSLYLKNQNADVFVCGKKIGHIGVVHPFVCKEFGVPYPIGCFEISLELLFSLYEKK